VFSEKLTVAWLIEKLSAFSGARKSLQTSQDPAKGPYPEPDESNAKSSLFSKDTF
jgi:hypothetical protein